MKRRRVYARYEGGKQTKTNAKDIQENELVSARNVYLDKIGTIKSAGVSAINSGSGKDYTAITFSDGVPIGYGLFQAVFDYNDAGTNTPTTKTFVAYKNGTTNLKIKQAENGGTWADLLDKAAGSAVTFDDEATPIYHMADGNIRICDTTFSSNSRVKWYGYIKRTTFKTQSLSSSTTINGYFTKDNDLPAPAAYTVGDGGVSYPNAGGPFDYYINDTSGGDWEAGDYQFAQSWVYDGNQESLLRTSSAITIAADNSKIGVTVGAKAPYEERISGARLYIRKSGTDDPWTLFADVDISEGIRTQLDSDYSSWSAQGGTNEVRTGEVLSYKPNIDTYEIINGYSPDEKSLTIGAAGEGYKTSVVSNGRTFVANVKAVDKIGEVRHMPDRIMYSQTGKYDIIPTSNFIDIGANDGDEFIKLESFADRLLAFKNDKLYVINIGGGGDTQWFLESEHSTLGAKSPNAVIKVDFGILWVNENGLFLYDGSKVNNLQTKILDTDWASDFGGDGVSLGYLPKRKFIVISKSSANTTNHEDILLFHLPTNSLVDIDNFRLASSSISNMITDNNGKVTFALEGTADGLYSFNGDQDDIINGEVIFRFDDLNEPHLKKKFFKVLVNYKQSHASGQTTPITYNFIDGAGDYTTIGANTLTGNMVQATTNPAVDEFLFNADKSPKIGQGLQLKFAPTTNSGTWEINDISVVYRLLDGKLIGD